VTARTDAGMKIVRLAGVVLYALAMGCRAADTPVPAGFAKQVDEFVAAEMRRQQVPGAAIGIFRKDQVLIAKGYGDSNIEHQVPVTSETVFQSGSVGKQFTAVAVMLQVEDGELSLDDSITKYFTDAPESWRPITVRHLLTHTSGIQDYFDGLWNGGTDVFDVRRDYTEEEMTKAIYGLPLEFEPGSRWHYSSTGYVLLGYLVRRVSGRFYGDVLKERVFAPLGMKTTRVISDEDIIPNRAAGYRLVNGEIKNQEWYAPSVNTTADGALFLSLEDFAAWDRGLRSGAILPAGSWAQIHAPVRLSSGKTYPYGFGWLVDKSNGGPWYHHSGHSQGFAIYISRCLADDLTIVVLTNLIDADPSRFVDGIAAILDPALAKIRPSTPIPDADLALAERVRGLLGAVAEGKLRLQELHEPNRSLVELVRGYAEVLHPLGALQRLELLDRRELGDDRVSTYAAHFGSRTFRVQVAVAPDDRIADLYIEPE
jgi:CubicO group peptidase (beta-lactamase class C family)